MLFAASKLEDASSFGKEKLEENGREVAIANIMMTGHMLPPCDLSDMFQC